MRLPLRWLSAARGFVAAVQRIVVWLCVAEATAFAPLVGYEGCGAFAGCEAAAAGCAGGVGGTGSRDELRALG